MICLILSCFIRLKLSPKFKSSGPEQGGIPEAERPRVEETSPTSTTTIDAEGAVQISLADAGGNYVKVSNVGDVVRCYSFIDTTFKCIGGVFSCCICFNERMT